MNKQELIKQITDKCLHPDELKYSIVVDLEDLLIAVNKNSLFSDVKVAITSEGLFFDTAFYDVKDWDTQVFWQLGKPLHEQDEECLEFIWEILK